MNWDTSAKLELTRIFEGATEKCLGKLGSFINYYYYYYYYYYYVALICEASKELELVVKGVGIKVFTEKISILWIAQYMYSVQYILLKQ